MAADVPFEDEVWPVPSLRRIAILSVLTIVLGFGGIGLWAWSTPLDSAVPAQGLFVAEGKRKTVSLLDPGTLKELLVREGDRVSSGQVLLVLDDVQPRATMNQSKAQYWSAVARVARLTAETQDKRDLVMPPSLIAVAQSDGTIAGFMRAETALFAARWDTNDGTVRVGERKIAQYQAQSQAVEGQIASLTTRLSLTREEARGVAILLKDGFAPRNRALEMARTIAELEGALGDATGRLAEAGHALAQTQLEMTNRAETRRSDAAKELQETEAAMADAVQRLRSAEDLLTKREIVAPESGTVTDIRFFTPGSGIGSGQPILDIVPAAEHLLIEAPISPTDIEHVRPGLRVNVRLSAYKAHRVPAVAGRVVYVAADRQQDAQGNPVFIVRAELDRDALQPFAGVRVYPGMPAELLIIGGERTALDFILSPILDGMRRGMREE